MKTKDMNYSKPLVKNQTSQKTMEQYLLNAGGGAGGGEIVNLETYSPQQYF